MSFDLERDGYEGHEGREGQEEARRDGDGGGSPPGQSLLGPTIKAHPFRRAVAFGIDMTIVGTVCSMVDQFISIPVPPLVIGLLHAGILLLYFLILHWPPTPIRSLGKKLMKLHILDERDGVPGAGAIAARYGLLATIFMVDWTGTLMWLSPVQVPGLAPVLLRTFGVGVVLCSVLLVVFDADGRTVHDRLFGTRVRRLISMKDAAARDTEGGERPAPRERRVAPLAILSVFAAFAAAMALFGYGLGSFGPEIGSHLLAAAPDYQDPARQLEQKIARDLGIRSDVELTYGRHWSSGGGATRFLKITVSLPFLVSDDATRQYVVGLIVDNLTVQPNVYDDLKVDIKSGFPIMVTRTFELTQNES